MTMTCRMRTGSRPCEDVFGFAIEPEPGSLGSPRIDVAVAAAALADLRRLLDRLCG